MKYLLLLSLLLLGCSDNYRFYVQTAIIEPITIYDEDGDELVFITSQGSEKTTTVNAPTAWVTVTDGLGNSKRQEIEDREYYYVRGVTLVKRFD